VRLVIAPDKFKGCMEAAAVCQAIASGWRSADPSAELDLCPMADGGEGTAAALLAACGGRLIRRRVTGPLPEMSIDAAFALLADGQTAVVEMAAASGLALLAACDRNPLATTTFGAGELMAAAAQSGARRIIVGLGGSATMDGGIGALQACGLPVLLQDNEPVCDSEPLTGADLEKVVFIKHGRGGKVDRIAIEAACDVDNPLCGPQGAAAVYGPQKGATPDQVNWFDRQFRRIAQRTGTQAVAGQSGAGAAGGLGFALAAFLGATLRPGIELVIEQARLEERLKTADLCITGEGKLDAQSLRGKTAVGVGRLCKRLGVPCVALAGSVAGGLELAAEGINAGFCICDGPMALPQAMADAPALLSQTAANVARLIHATRRADRSGR
jgi:glycerate 2-kinase